MTDKQEFTDQDRDDVQLLLIEMPVRILDEFSDSGTVGTMYRYWVSIIQNIASVVVDAQIQGGAFTLDDEEDKALVEAAKRVAARFGEDKLHS